jgi:hypothetical protein
MNKKKYDSIFDECSKIYIDYKKALEKDKERKLELFKIEEKIALQKEEDKRLLAVEKARQVRQAEADAEEARYQARKELNIKEAEKKEGLTLEEEEEQKIKQEEQKKINAKIRATKVKEFFSINNRKIKYDNLSDKQDDKYQKLQSFEEKGKFLDALPIPET